MPVQYDGWGVSKEHLHCREHCGIFDVSHMGQFHIKGEDAAAFLEKVTVVDTKALKPGKCSLSVIMNENGGIVDDCIVNKVTEEHFYVVLNAGCKHKDIAHFENYIDEFPATHHWMFPASSRSLIAV